jgi:hypothetical protein
MKQMNVDHILSTMNRHGVRYLLIGGMNFMLRHEPVLTFDIDLWIEDTEANRRNCETALVELETTWGPTDDTWQPVANLGSGWLDEKQVYCTLSTSGAIDIFRSVRGLSNWTSCNQRALNETTKEGVQYFALSDEDMLACQLALDEGERKQSRINSLRATIKGT